MNALADNPYAGYTYAYPHKTAYRAIEPTIALKDAWRDEPKDALFLYFHIPFCEMRCGFCNLFTQSRPRGEVVARFLAALRRQADATREALGDARFARFAVGGGTPTFLEEADLAELLRLAESFMAGPVSSVPSSVETSPTTATEGRLAILRDFGVRRISIGVQSFTEKEVRAAARPQQTTEVHDALLRIRAANFPVLNIDLIYGLPEQDVASWLASVRSALRYQPEELFLYPLHVRPLTGLGKSKRAWDDVRMECYREARDLLVSEGYVQESMRAFRARHAPAEGGPAYCVQDDGMVGLGCGARSYTRGLHYSMGYAVRQEEVANLIADYSARDSGGFTRIHQGFHLDESERRRRFLLLGLLQTTGVDEAAYAARFGGTPERDFAEVSQLLAEGLAERNAGVLRLTERGLALSDAIGPALYSGPVRERMEAHQWI